MNQEIELKLFLPDGAARLRPSRLARLLGATARASKSQLETTYFDGPDGWLRGRGMALRVRRDGKRHIQTLKLPMAGPDGLQSYFELEAEISGDRPILDAIGDGKVRQRLQRSGLMARLRPVFTTRFERHAFTLHQDGSDIEVALDLGAIECRLGALPIAEIEFELKAGDPRSLFHCAERVVEEVGGRLGHLSKAARGYRLALGQAPTPMRAEPLHLPRKGTAGEAFAAIMRNCLEQLRGNEDAVLVSEDAEAIHQFRVAIRRLRAAIGAYREFIEDDAHAMLSIDLRWLQRQFGPARDIDVLIADTLLPMQARLKGQPAIDTLIDFAQAARSEARRQAHLALENPRYASLLLHAYRLLLTGEWRGRSPAAQSALDQSARAFAKPLLARRHRRLLRLGGAHADLSETDLHRLRLLAKKMRYAAQAFASLYPDKRTERYVGQLGAIQDHLGSLNDAVVGRQLLVDLVGRLRQEHHLPEGMVRFLEGLVVGWKSRRIAVDLADFPATWQSFLKQKKFWTAD
ncbi:inorganic triphosphatase YgiF [Dongia mobilis]|uniref:Inorganic triphosphatase YgiF n=1 Tax=Dongia mobilis TaxID=578943 RepID=A0A4V3DET1_9PROT|nr:inorganic triphosphatase YgiF [Dongia mobilis]